MFGQRLGLLLAGFLVAAGVLVLRLWWVQFVADDEIRRRALEAQKVVIDLPAARGAIRDAAGRVLARDRAAFSVELIPSTYRERALIHAIVDLEVMIGKGGGQGEGRRGPEGEPWRIAHLREDARNDPWAAVESVLRLPASATRADVRSTGKKLCAPEGDLIREALEMKFRLRQCLGVVQGRGLPFRPGDLEEVQRHDGDLASALNVDVDAVAARLAAEVQVIEEVGAALGFESGIAMWERLASLVDREYRWVRDQKDAEYRSLAFLDEFGAPVFDPRRVELTEYLAVAHDLALPFRDDDWKAADRALSGARALLGGRLPDVAAGAPVEPEEGEPPAVREAPPSRADILEAADAEGLVDCDPRRLGAAWFEREREAQRIKEDEYLSRRRRGMLRARYRGGRSFVVGRGAPASVAARVVGPGRLESIGFRIVPAFVRDAAVTEQLDPFIRHLIGTVTADSRDGAFGVEAALNDELKGENGTAKLNRAGAVELETHPAKADDVRLSLDIEVVRKLQAVAPRSIPFGLAVIDVRTGAVVGMSTGPTAEDMEGAFEGVAERWVERRALLRVKNMLDEDKRAHQLGYLRSRPQLNREEAAMKTALEGVARAGLAWVEDRLRQLRVQDAASAGFHRAVRIPHQSPPGSVFKALTILLGLREGVIDGDTTFDCIGTDRPGAHGCKNHGAALTIRRALAKSCNAYCYEVGRELKVPPMLDFYEELGVFEPIPGLSVPRFRRASFAAGAGPENLSIGMGGIDCVPVRAAALAASLATGRVVRPWFAGKPPPLGKPIVPAGSEWMLKLVHDGMAAVCSDEGTAREFRHDLQRLRVAAKTGTADHPGPAGHTVNEAWFVGFAPVEAPKLAFAVVLPNARSGGEHGKGVQGADAAPHAIKALEICAEAMGIRWW